MPFPRSRHLKEME